MCLCFDRRTLNAKADESTLKGFETDGVTSTKVCRFLCVTARLTLPDLLEKDTSDYLLDKLKPDIVLSGDDHDVCIVEHRPGVAEYTIPTFSWLQVCIQCIRGYTINL